MSAPNLSAKPPKPQKATKTGDKAKTKRKTKTKENPQTRNPRKPAKRRQNDPEFADKLVLRLWTSATLYIMVRPMLRGQLTE